MPPDSTPGTSPGVSAERTALVYTSIAEDYDSTYSAPTHRRLYDKLAWERVNTVALPPGAKIVDVGCGTGRWAARWLADGHHVTCIESSPGMIAALGARGLERHGTRFRLIDRQMEQVELETGTADMVVAMGSVQYAADPAAMIARMAQWLRPGGTLCLYVDSLVATVIDLIREGRNGEAMTCLQTHRGSFGDENLRAGLYLYDRARLLEHLSDAALLNIRISGLAVTATAMGRAACGAAFEADEAAVLTTERILSNSTEFADVGIHLFASATRS